MQLAGLLRFALPFSFRRNGRSCCGRTPAQRLEHYVIERELAERLRQAPREARAGLYRRVYDELLRRVPHHPMLQARSSEEERARRARAVAHQIAFLGRFFTPRSVFMEIGAGDCMLSMAAARYVERVHAVEVSEEIVRSARCPSNMKLALYDGMGMPVPEASVDVAFSDQLMEHLHPDDAREQIGNIHRSLVPGGIYVFVTPNRFYGPRDISAHFDEVATGLHLREYSAREIRALLREAGFRTVRFYAGARGVFTEVPYWLVAAAETLLARLPYRVRKRIADTPPMRALLGLRVAAVK